MNGVDLKDQIQDKVDYASATSSTVLVQPEEGTGSTVPPGNYSFKVGYSFKISFSENPEYSFLRWKAVDKNNPEVEIKDVVHFQNPASIETEVTVTSDRENIRILPECARRIAVDGEPSPRYDPKGVGRDTQISVQFTKAPSKDSFVFSPEEVPSEAETIVNEDGEIWAYKLDELVYFKNISIANAGGISIAEHFCQPVVDGKLLKIDVDSENPIQIQTGVTFETICVTLDKDISDESGIKMNYEKEWKYQITRETGAKAKITLSCDVSAGSVKAAGTDSYSIGQEIPLVFTENMDYQFLRWNYDSDIVYIEEPENPSTKAVVRAKTDLSEITAVCAERLRVVSFEPVCDSANPTVPKNSKIEITFNKNIPDDEVHRLQLNNILIALGGTPVNTSFFAPVVAGSTITFTADRSNMLDVPEGQTKTVTVTVPGDLYYLDEDGNKVYYGGNGKTFTYKIDETTSDKAEITFARSEKDSGTIEVSREGPYSIGQEIALEYKMAGGYKFNGWKIAAPEEEYAVVPSGRVTDGKIEVFNADQTLLYFTLTISNDNPLKAKGVVHESAGAGFVMSIDDLLIPVVVRQTPEYHVNGVNLDVPIEITFNKAVRFSDSANPDFLFSVYDDSGSNLIHCFETAVLSEDGKTLVLKTKPALFAANFTVEKIKTFNVSIRSGYLVDSDGISLEGYYDWQMQVAKVVYKNEREDSKPNILSPVLYAGLAEGYGKYREFEEDFYNYTVSDTVFESWTTPALSRKDLSNVGAANYTAGKVKISTVYGTDADTEVKSLYISEKLYRYSDNKVPEDDKSVVRSELVEDCFTYNPRWDRYELTEPYVYTFQTPEDGIIELSLQVVDEAGNKSAPKIYYLIKDTVFDIKTQQFGLSVTEDNKVSADGKIRTLKITPSGQPEYYASNDTVTFSTQWSQIANFYVAYYTYFLEYVDYNGERKTTDKKYMGKQGNYPGNGINLEINPKERTEIVLHVFDGVGNEDTLAYDIPGAVSLINRTEDSYWITFNIADIEPPYSTGDDEVIVRYKFFYRELTQDETGNYIEGSDTRLYNSNRSGSDYYYTRDTSDFLYSSAEPENYRVYVVPSYSRSVRSKEGRSNYTRIYGVPSLVYDSTVSGSGGIIKPVFAFTNIRPGSPNSGDCHADCSLSSGIQEGVKYYLQSDGGLNSLITFDESGKSVVSFPAGSSSTYYWITASNGTQFVSGDKTLVNTSSCDTNPPIVQVGIGALNSIHVMRDDQFTYSYDGSYLLAYRIEDYNVGFQKDEKGFFNIGCYYTETPNYNMAFDSLTASWLDAHKSWPHNNLRALSISNANQNHLNVYNAPIGSYYRNAFELVDIEDDVCTFLWLDVTDKNGNFCSGIYTNGIMHTLKQKPQIDYSGSGLTVRFNEEQSDKHSFSNYSVTLMYFDTSVNEWITAAATKYEVETIAAVDRNDNAKYRWVPDSTASTKMSAENSRYELTFNDSSNSTEGLQIEQAFGAADLAGKFVKIVVRADVDRVPDAEYTIQTDDETAFSYPSYLYIGSNECTASNLMASKNGVTVMSDKPVYVQTISSNKNRGDAVSDISEWERRGKKLNCQVLNFDSGHTIRNYRFDDSEIEAGDYYVVVAHFADGTSAISDVLQK